MSFSSGTSSGAADTIPSRGDATMVNWKAWVDGLSRYERDQLYPGMHIDLIPAYEMIEAQEERKQEGYASGLSAAAGPQSVSSLPTSSFSSGFAPLSLHQPRRALRVSSILIIRALCPERFQQIPA